MFPLIWRIVCEQLSTKYFQVQPRLRCLINYLTKLLSGIVCSRYMKRAGTKLIWEQVTLE